MKVLVVAGEFPHPDKASGDLRFFSVLSLLANEHQVIFCALNNDGSVQSPDENSARLFMEAGIELGENNLLFMLKKRVPEIVWFEFYHQAREDYVALVRRRCQNARIVVDSVDVHFNRFEARARLTHIPEDSAIATDVKKRELAAYTRADMVIAVSDDDRLLLQRELPCALIDVIPNIHAVPAYPDLSKRRYGDLVFVGGFKHDPNVDAVLYFCREVMPLILQEHPEARLKIIGSNPIEAIQDLASEHIEVLGYVPETAPYLENAYISIAPLRYGGGMKGKVGEAMSYGLPVVTTSFGAEGFGLEPGRDLLIGDSAENFAAQVIALLNDADLHARIARSGYDFIVKNYSVTTVVPLLESSMQRLKDLPARKTLWTRRLMATVQDFCSRHIAWRLPRR